MDDISLLSGLTELKWLYLDMWQLSSLKGIESLSRLVNLTIHSDISLDLSPLAALKTLHTLDVSGIKTADWSVLNALPELEQLICSESQKPLIQKILPENKFNSVIK